MSGRRAAATADAGGAFEGAGHLIRAVAAHAPGLSLLALALLLGAAVTEAFGLALIVPLLYVSGLAGASDEQHPVAESVARAAAYVGVELTLPAVLGVFLMLAAVRTAAGWQRQRILARISLGFVDRLRENLYASVAEAKWTQLARWRPSDIHHTLTSDVRRAGRGANLLFQLTVGIVLAVAQFGVALLIAPLVSVGALVAGASLVLVSGPLTRRARRRGSEQTQGNKKVYALVADFLAGLRLVKCHNAEARHVEEYRSAVRALRRPPSLLPRRSHRFRVRCWTWARRSCSRPWSGWRSRAPTWRCLNCWCWFSSSRA